RRAGELGGDAVGCIEAPPDGVDRTIVARSNPVRSRLPGRGRGRTEEQFESGCRYGQVRPGVPFDGVVPQASNVVLFHVSQGDGRPGAELGYSAHGDPAWR